MASRGELESAWIASTAPIAREPLRAELRADVCVVGAGIAGLSAAYAFAVEEGPSVVVLELSSAAGNGETGSTTAHLASAIDDRFTEIERIAVHRDAEGALHVRRARCPHLGCAVAWNRLENTWDCPCHGSRFDARGRLLHGPAHRDLDPVDEERTALPRAADA